MGFLSKLKAAWNFTKEAAPVLPIPNKAKRIIAKGGEVEEDVKAIVDEVKPKKPQS